ncbi:XRE family transcriptional regulator [Pseudomonas protegens]|uniref:XRE family transcriptional regulator n=1 Tax=Pseudomonas protegens TaxID=380021 RepID=UPI002852E4BF|nr:helix-turn-helix transcriptional regulator [Pseudomonas protegens]
MFMTTENSGDRLRLLMTKRGITPKVMADALAISPQALNNWLSRGVPGKNLHQVCVTLSVRPEWLMDGQGEMDMLYTSPQLFSAIRRDQSIPGIQENAALVGPIDVWDDDTPLDEDEVYVPFLKEVELSAGSGRTVVEQSHKQKLRFGRLTLRRQGVQPEDAVCVTVSGNSMEPVLPDKSTVGVDQGCTTITDGKMYAIDHDGQLRVKTLYRLPGGGIRMRSFNRDEHPDEEYTAQDMAEQNIHIKGKVFWSSVLW